MAAMTDRRLSRFRDRLRARRHETLAQVARTERELRSLGANVEPELEDEAQEETATLLLTRLDERARAAVAAIDRALARIASGSYGQCGTCGGAIGVRRLDAVPEAETCIACAAGDARTTTTRARRRVASSPVQRKRKATATDESTRRAST